MFFVLFTTAFVLGLSSSFHCVGMCGPLLLAVPTRASINYQWLEILIYHTARIFTYALLGVLVGFAGWRLQVANLQQFFSLTIGIILLIYVFAGRFFADASWLLAFNKMIFSFFGFAAKQKGQRGTLLLGVANGLLPCGMVYIALTGAMASASATAAAGFMTLFGLGTLPLLFVFNFYGIRLQASVKQRIKFVSPIVIAIMGILLIIRGLNLGIPYISPHFVNNGGGVACH
jgi:sulfite exporter TauE/SafE